VVARVGRDAAARRPELTAFLGPAWPDSKSRFRVTGWNVTKLTNCRQAGFRFSGDGCREIKFQRVSYSFTDFERRGRLSRHNPVEVRIGNSAECPCRADGQRSLSDCRSEFGPKIFLAVHGNMLATKTTLSILKNSA
jgi:hypothetical protein